MRQDIHGNPISHASTRRTSIWPTCAFSTWQTMGSPRVSWDSGVTSSPAWAWPKSSSIGATWWLAGEGTMPYYLSKTKEQDAETQKQGLTELARYVRTIDAHHHPITIHPSSSARLCVTDPSLLDFDMLQTGHNDRQSVPNTIEKVQASLAASPQMPVLIGEV